MTAPKAATSKRRYESTAAQEARQVDAAPPHDGKEGHGVEGQTGGLPARRPRPARHRLYPTIAPFAPAASNHTVRTSRNPASASQAPYSAGV